MTILTSPATSSRILPSRSGGFFRRRPVAPCRSRSTQRRHRPRHRPEHARARSSGARRRRRGRPISPSGLSMRLRPSPPARPVTLDYVRWAAANVSIPWFAIGGINLRNLDDVLAAGAKRICVVSAILNERDVAAACREFRRRLLVPDLSAWFPFSSSLFIAGSLAYTIAMRMAATSPAMIPKRSRPSPSTSGESGDRARSRAASR